MYQGVVGRDDDEVAMRNEGVAAEGELAATVFSVQARGFETN